MAKRLLPPLLTFIAIAALLELGVRALGISSFLLPTPSAVAKAMERDRVELWDGTVETAEASAIGFAMAAGAGFALAVLLSAADWSRRAFYPYAVFFQTVPIIAIAPLLVIWFGYGMPTEVASAAIVAVFPVIANTLAGLLSADGELVDLFRLYGAGRIDSLLKLRIPAALPNVITGLRVAAGLAVIGAIVGEFIAGGGLGAVIDAARTQQRTDKVFAAVVLAAILGAALLGLVGVIGTISLRRWKAA